jgi:hypothetical protein
MEGVLNGPDIGEGRTIADDRVAERASPMDPALPLR